MRQHQARAPTVIAVPPRAVSHVYFQGSGVLLRSLINLDSIHVSGNELFIFYDTFISVIES